MYLIKLIGAVLGEFKLLLLPKLLVDEVVAISEGADLSQHLSNAILYIALTLGAEFLSNVLQNIANSTINYEKVYLDRILTYRLSQKSMEMDFQYTEDPDVLDQRTKAQDGIEWYSGGVTGIISCFYDVVFNLALMVTSVTLFMFYCPLLLPVQIIGMGFICFFNFQSQKVALAAFLRLGKLNRLFGYYLYDVASQKYGKDARLYDSSELMSGNAGKFGGMTVDTFRDQSVGTVKFDYAGNVVNAFRDGISYFYLGYRTIKGFLTLGDLTMCISAASRLYQSLLGIGRSFTNLTQKCSYAYQFLVYLDYPDALYRGDTKVKEGEHEIVFENVSFKYPRAEEYVLENVNIRIKSGEHLSIVGLNGAGKTTFIKLLCRLYDVTEGRILIDGVDIKEYSIEEYRKLFAVVFQDFQLFAFSLKDNVAMGKADSDIDEKEVEEALKLSGLYEDAIQLDEGLNTRLFKSFDEHGTELSGGQKQKAAISRALYRNAPIVILDEPTAALDPLAEYDIYKKFDTLVGGKSAIYISHRLSSCKFCDHIAVFSDKTIKEYGTHDELVSKENGIYAEMFAAQSQYYVEAAS
ncbi:MAG: ABC transporter ATP-binding protein/permease [Butyrivibrio sp.]|nr:ABC transporter ATP-binding protein/permease [Butyrivibrio sp.]